MILIMNYVDRKYQEFYEKYGYIPKCLILITVMK